MKSKVQIYIDNIQNLITEKIMAEFVRTNLDHTSNNICGDKYLNTLRTFVTFNLKNIIITEMDRKKFPIDFHVGL
jgi:hypothetical protein